MVFNSLITLVIIFYFLTLKTFNYFEFNFFIYLILNFIFNFLKLIVYFKLVPNFPIHHLFNFYF